MEPSQAPRHRQTGVKPTNPILSAFKEVIFTKPTTPTGQSAILTPSQTTTTPLSSSSSSFGQGQIPLSSQGQGYPNVASTTPIVTTTTTTTFESPISEVPGPGGYEMRPEVISQTTVTTPVVAPLIEQPSDWQSRSTKEEPIYPHVLERARQMDRLLEAKRLEAKEKRVAAEMGYQKLESRNVPETEFPNEIPMPPPPPPKTATTSKRSAGVTVIKETTLRTVETAKQTAASVKETTTQTLETAKQTVASGVNVLKETVEVAKEKASSGIQVASEGLQYAKETATHTMETVKEGAVTGLSKAKATTAYAAEQVKEKGAVGLEKAKEVAEKAWETEQIYMEKAKEKAVEYGQQGAELAKDTAVYGAHQAVEKLPTVKEYTKSLALAAVEIGKETVQLVKEVISEGVHIAREEMGRGTTRRQPVRSHVVSGAVQPAIVLGATVPITYSEAEKRLQGMTEAALDKMNSLMASGNVAKDELSWRDAQHNLQQFAQFTVKNLWDFVHTLEIADFPERFKEIENQAFRSEKLIWDKLSDFEGKSWSGTTRTPAPFATSTTSSLQQPTEPTVIIRETTIINSSEGSKRSDFVEKRPISAITSPLSEA